MNFSELNLNPHILEGISTMGYGNPTPIQEQAIPVILQGRDLIACAQTGTGKTAAFLLPILGKIAEKPTTEGYINTLIIVPTRELALQIDQQVEGFAYFISTSSIAVYGGNDGNSWDRQRMALEQGADIIVATPGRLLQHIQMGYVKLDRLEHLILDEADRMLDMGFFDDITAIISQLPTRRQTLMFSATMPPKIRQLAKTILDNPVEISLSVSKPVESILQAVYMVEDSEKIGLLQSLVAGKEYVQSVLVFASKKMEVKDIERKLVRESIMARAIHSDLEQSQREQVLRDFRNRKFQVLVATDIVARGIDIEDIDLVVNYNVPADPEDYVHRIGRTARAQSDGVAITFVNKKERPQLARIEKFLGEPIFRVSHS
ncbi:MAG TPA: DEAD/DEAH box helicase [Tenuifilaceae bacterium]|nr:DEAD/DEAH box helicase [Tenuifilaceae bacterium]HOA09404.1 DEAD/DEAH box helicase [Tenuifilaceae bacterium]